MEDLKTAISGLKRKLEWERETIQKKRLLSAGWTEQKKIRAEEAKAEAARNKAEEKRLEAEKQRLAEELRLARAELVKVNLANSDAMDRSLLKNPDLYFTHEDLAHGASTVAASAASAVKDIQARSRYARHPGNKKNGFTSPFYTVKRVVTSADGESCIVFDWSDKTFETLHDYRLFKTSATYPLDAPDRDEYFRESDPKYSPSGAFQMVWYILPESGDPLDGVFAITEKVGCEFKADEYDSDLCDYDSYNSWGLGENGTGFRVQYYRYRETLACTSGGSEAHKTVEIGKDLKPGEPQWMAAGSASNSKSPMPGFFSNAWDLLSTVTQNVVGGMREYPPRKLVGLTANCYEKTMEKRAVILSLEMKSFGFDTKTIKKQAVDGRSVYHEKPEKVPVVVSVLKA